MTKQQLKHEASGGGIRTVATIRPPSSNLLDPKEFFERFVALRKPCIIDGLPPVQANGNQALRLSSQDLIETAGDEVWMKQWGWF